MTPPIPLGDFMIGLALGDGERLADGDGVLAEGRTISNVGFRRLMGL